MIGNPQIKASGNKARLCGSLIVAAVIVVTCASFSSAQSRSEARTTFASRVDVVALPVTVQAPDGTFVRDLGPENFHVFENGVEQPISVFGAGEVPVDLFLLIDTSASMRDQLAAAQHAAAILVDSLSDRDRAALFAFGGRLAQIQALTTDRAGLKQSIWKLRAGGDTPLHDAVYVALKQFAASSRQPELRRRALVVLSDGDDTSSHVSFESLLQLAREVGVAIYTVVVRRLVISADERFGMSDFEMRRLAHETGARAFFPATAENLDPIYASIARELANQYSIGYVPRSQTGHTFVRVAVTVDQKNAVVRARTGYVADAGF